MVEMLRYTLSLSSPVGVFNFRGLGWQRTKSTPSAVIWDDRVCLHGTSGKHLPVIREE